MAQVQVSTQDDGQQFTRVYYEDRAEAELAAAQSAGHPAAVRAHYLLAGFYLDLVHGTDAQKAA